jgi:hypothetical protein
VDQAADDRAAYRQVIDRLVASCREGQGQIGAQRTRAGLWNADADTLPDSLRDQREEQRRYNALLRSMSAADREVMAAMLREQFVSGVHETLVVLHEAQLEPFDDGYEGTPFHDFVGRLNDWPWPPDAAHG